MILFQKQVSCFWKALYINAVVILGLGMSVQRFFGGSPGSVIIKLVFISLLVGAFMAALGITPMGLLDRLTRMINSLFSFSFETVKEVGRWLLYGAAIVVPIWLILRIFNRFR